MAQKITEILVDDLDGSIADETVHFGLDGIDYVIDLNKDNAGRLRNVLLLLAASGREASPRSRGLRPGSTPADRTRNQAIRDWANAHGMNVPARGRLPKLAIQKYNQRSTT